MVEEVPETEQTPGLTIHDSALPSLKTLGVWWNAELDVFEFRVDLLKIMPKYSKRDVLSTIATLFDPMQFLAPFSVRAKVLMQEIWMAGLGWDDALPDHLLTKWHKWVTELKDLHTA